MKVNCTYKKLKGHNVHGGINVEYIKVFQYHSISVIPWNSKFNIILILQWKNTLYIILYKITNFKKAI